MQLFAFLLTLLVNVGLYAQETAEAPPRDQGFTQTLIMIAIAILFFYLILWRPEQKRRKTQETLRNSLKKGDRVTAMGIIGTVATVKENSVIVSMFDGSKLEFVKAAISEVLPATSSEADKEEKKEQKS